MKVILLEDVRSLGKKGEVVDISDGYARNFIIPKKKGIEANSKNMNDLKLKLANQERVAAENLVSANLLSKELEDKPVIIKAKTGESGKLFGAIATKEIAEAVMEQHGLEIDKKKIVLDEPIKELGEHIVRLKLHKDVTAELKVIVKDE